MLQNAFSKKKGRHSRGMTAAMIVMLAAILVWILCHIGDIANGIAQMGIFLKYTFIQRALVVGALVSLCASLLGVSLVLKRYSMIGDGLSHVGFGALTIAMALGFVTVDSLPAFLPASVRAGLVKLCGAIAQSPLPLRW